MKSILGTVIVGVCVLALLGALIISLIKSRKKGGSCCGGCAGCPMSAKCHGTAETDKG